MKYMGDPRGGNGRRWAASAAVDVSIPVIDVGMTAIVATSIINITVWPQMTKPDVLIGVI